MSFKGYVAGTDVTSASISAVVDESSVSTTRLGGKLVFSTTADGANSPSERVVIEKDGDVVIDTLTLYVLVPFFAHSLSLIDAYDAERRLEAYPHLVEPF